MLPETIAVRLRQQLGAVPLILAGTDPLAADRPPAGAPGKWCAREHLAHLARYHEITAQRLDRLRHQDGAGLERYRAEDDPEWPGWQERSLADVLAALTRGRAALLAQIDSLPPAALEHRGVHPVLGALPVPLLLEFFLLHEAHHLYTALPLLRARPPAQP